MRAFARSCEQLASLLSQVAGWMSRLCDAIESGNGEAEIEAALTVRGNLVALPSSMKAVGRSLAAWQALSGPAHGGAN